MALELRLPSLSLTWEYPAGKGALNWHPFQRKERQSAVLSLVPKKVEEWLERLLEPKMKDLDTIRKIDRAYVWVHVETLDDDDAAAERIARTLAGSILTQILGSDRREWPTVGPGDGYRDPTIAEMLTKRIHASKAALQEAQGLLDQDPRFLVLKLRLESVRGTAMKSVPPPQLAGFFAPYMPRIEQEIAAIKAVPSTEVHDRLVKRMNQLKAQPDEESQAVACGLAMFASDCRPATKAAFDQFVAGTPEAKFLDNPRLLAEALAKHRAQGPRPKILLPGDVPRIGEYKAPSVSPTDGAAAPVGQPHVLVERAVSAARRLQNPTDEYYTLEEQVAAWDLSHNAVERQAAVLLREFLYRQKSVWAKQRIQELYSRKPTGNVTLDWSMPAYVRAGNAVQAGQFDPSKLPGLSGTLLPLTKVNKALSVVKRSWDKIVKVVDPTIINMVPPCYVVFDPKQQRAYHYENYMVIGPNDLEDRVVMHEFGHHLEDNLPPEVWYRIHKLIEGRSGGTERKVGIKHPADWERGFVAEMPGTGDNRRYATRYYAGPTEVVSTGIEALADPTSAYRLYVEDPQHFALIVSVLQQGMTSPAAGGTTAGGPPTQAGPTVQTKGAAGRVDRALVYPDAERGFQGAAQRLPHLGKIQRSFGHHDVSAVQSFVGGPAAAASDKIGAKAYASGDRVAFKQQPDLKTAAHEAAHVVQQRGGIQLKGNTGEAGDRWERHADRVADLVARGQSAQPLLDQVAGGTGSRATSAARFRPVQRLAGDVEAAPLLKSVYDQLTAAVKTALPTPAAALPDPNDRNPTALYIPNITVAMVLKAQGVHSGLDANLNDKKKVAFEVDLATTILKDQGPVDKVVKKVSRRIGAYLEAKVNKDVALLEAERKKLGKNMGNNQMFLGRIANVVQQDEMAGVMKKLLAGEREFTLAGQGTYEFTLSNHLLAHHQFMDEIWDPDYKADPSAAKGHRAAALGLFKVDINTAPVADIVQKLGIPEAMAAAIVAGRPYARKDHVKRIMGPHYDLKSHWMVASPAGTHAPAPKSYRVPEERRRELAGRAAPGVNPMADGAVQVEEFRYRGRFQAHERGVHEAEIAAAAASQTKVGGMKLKPIKFLQGEPGSQSREVFGAPSQDTLAADVQITPLTGNASGITARPTDAARVRGGRFSRLEGQPQVRNEDVTSIYADYKTSNVPGAAGGRRGVDYHTMNERDKFIQEARLVHNMPTAGAISGTTADMLEVGKIMGLTGKELQLYALAVLGQLETIGAHSFHEIALAAKYAGVVPGYSPDDYASFIPEEYASQARPVFERHQMSSSKYGLAFGASVAAPTGGAA